jgi:amidohydrolase
MQLSPQDLVWLGDMRRSLHKSPDLSGDEGATAARIVAALKGMNPDQIITGLGGHGVAAVFGCGEPSVMFRAELDALPIEELSDVPHKSTHLGKGHLCGHDGHMAMLLGLGLLVSRARPASGRAVLMFQPAEETGAGARAVTDDPAYEALRPAWAFAIHNMPRWPLGAAQSRVGTVNCASVGMRIALKGKTAHASQPETGLSPALAIAGLIPELMGLGGGAGDDFRLVTITHARLGEAAFGVAPGAGEVWVTLRAITDAGLTGLVAEALDIALDCAAQHGLAVFFEKSDHFAASVNDGDAVAVLQSALGDLGMGMGAQDLPMRASEDFGRFGNQGTRSAMLFLGAGEDVPDLHNPDYDFPDALLPIGISVFQKVLQRLLPP